MAERFWVKVNFDGPVSAARPDLGPCWLWTACTNKGGYGSFAFQTTSPKRTELAHRVSFAMQYGFWPPESTDHLCRTRACVNPFHLEDVTPLVNAQRGAYAMQTHCIAGHLFDEANTLNRKRGGRWCRACHRDRTRERTGWDGSPPNGEKTHCPQGHEYTPENTYRIPSTGTRLCRECQRVHSATRTR